MLPLVQRPFARNYLTSENSWEGSSFCMVTELKKAVLTSSCFESDRGWILCSLLNHSQELVFYSKHNRTHLEDAEKEIKNVIAK